MKLKLFYFVIVFSLISCTQEKEQLDYAQQKADEFVQDYAPEFLKDNDLLTYSYHPRAQFTNDKDSLNVYRIFLRKNEIRLICFSDSCILSESFNNLKLKLSKGRYTLKKDSIITELAHDSTIAKRHSFKYSPEKYFDELKNRIDKFGVFAYTQATDKSVIKVYLTVEYYLIQTKEVNDKINKDQIIKSYNDNWYFVKMENPMDLG